MYKHTKWYKQTHSNKLKGQDTQTQPDTQTDITTWNLAVTCSRSICNSSIMSLSLAGDDVIDDGDEVCWPGRAICVAFVCSSINIIVVSSINIIMDTIKQELTRLLQTVCTRQLLFIPLQPLDGRWRWTRGNLPSSWSIILPNLLALYQVVQDYIRYRKCGSMGPPSPTVRVWWTSDCRLWSPCKITGHCIKPCRHTEGRHEKN